MSGAPALAKVVDAFVSEADEIESIFCTRHGRRSVVGVRYSYVPIEDGCLVSLWDAWSRFLRNLAVLSAAGPCVGLSGTTHTPTVARTENQVIADLIANKKGNDFGIVNSEPKWGDPKKLANIASFLGLSNTTTIVGAVTSSSIHLGPVTVSNPLEEVRVCRNYVAHKSPPTLSDMTQYAVGPFVDLSTHLRQPRSGVETFSEWRDCFAALAEAAGQ